MAHPDKLGKYAIQGVLGAGAMGVVYQGTDPGIGRQVALKTIQRALVQGNDAAVDVAARFRNEAQAAGRLSHPGIVSIYEYGEDGDTAFIAMEYVQGQDLAKVLAANPVLPEPTLLRIMDQLLDALQHAHQQGVWHRDIKPANLILTHTGQLKVTDFGIARIQGAALTKITSAIGTHGYMAPEQYTGQGIDHRVDIFASGVLLYALLTGHAAFAGSSPEATMYKVLHEVPQPPSARAHVPRTLQLDAVVAKAMAKAAYDRYDSAQAFRDAIRQDVANYAKTVPDGEVTVIDVPPSSLSLPLSTSALGSGLDGEAVSRLERTLTSFVGPLAKLLVKQATASCQDYGSLVLALAQHVPADGERARFIARATGGLGTPVPLTSKATTGGTPLQPSLSDELLVHATRVLTAHMGPMARFVVKQAAAQSRDQAGFFEAVMANCAEGVDRERLLRELHGR
ncbi:MAG: serine/threonine protein kinase [Rubrivivax sp.]|nr:MAG: serine/threonine protein kinase [Rubrivivax sp.]